jgi:hypothetical protein
MHLLKISQERIRNISLRINVSQYYTLILNIPKHQEYISIKLVFFLDGRARGKDLHCKRLQLKCNKHTTVISLPTRLLSYTAHTTYTLLLKTQIICISIFFHGFLILLFLTFLCHSQHCYHICLPKILICTINDNNQEYATSSFTFPPSATQHKLNPIVP